MTDFLSRYSAYIFDFDGTLADTAGDSIPCMHKALALLNLPDAEISPYDIGPPLEQIYRRLIPNLSDADIAQLIPTFQKLYNSLENPVTQLYPGIVPVLERLVQRGALCCMATNKSLRSTLLLLERLGVAHLFTQVMCGDSLMESLGRKIDKAEMINVIIQQQAIAPHGCVMIGDSVYDIEGGKAAGVHTMAVLYGYGRAEVMLHTGADMIVRNADWREYLHESAGAK